MRAEPERWAALLLLVPKGLDSVTWLFWKGFVLFIGSIYGIPRLRSVMVINFTGKTKIAGSA